jgi:Fe-S cluster assembly protein SufB
MSPQKPNVNVNEDYEKLYGFHVAERSVYKAEPGLDAEKVKQISGMKSEPAWMLKSRLRAYQHFLRKPMPQWANTELLGSIKFDNIFYYLKPTMKQEGSWDEVPAEIKETFDRLGIPEAERKFLAGVSAQYESESVYHSMHEDLTKQGVIFLDMDSALREQPEMVQRHFGTVIPAADNKFAALNTAVWSGGSFIYVPKGVKVAMPLQAYFRINAKNMGQFERTLIIADEGAEVTYIEGCTAPTYSSDSLHSAVVELIAMPHAKIRYVTIQNWSKNVYNLVTKRAVAHEAATVEWLDGNLGSKLTMKYPGVYLMGRGARGEVLSVAFAGSGQHQDAGAKMIHAAPDTSSVITSKSISKGDGRTSYRGLVKVHAGASGSKSTVRCDALMLNKESRSDTYPTMEIDEKRVQIGHEATVSKIGDEQLFYAMSRGLSEQEAMNMIVNGFIEPFVKELPLEYAVELNRLVQLEMEGAVG